LTYKNVSNYRPGRGNLQTNALEIFPPEQSRQKGAEEGASFNVFISWARITLAAEDILSLGHRATSRSDSAPWGHAKLDG
jgi:hypothetical protein